MTILGTLGSARVMTFECLGDAGTEARFLDGRTTDGTVGLAPSTDSPFTGTRWEVTALAPGIATLKCLGTVDPPDHRRFLDGRTLDGSVGLASRTTAPFSGARWAITELTPGIVTLKCLGDIEGPEHDRYLDGRTIDGSVGLAPSTAEPFSGTVWRARSLGELVYLQCLGDIEGPRFLDGRTADGTAGLAVSTAEPFSGTLWLMGEQGEVTLECQGDVEGSRFLDGRTGDGSVGLAPSTAPPFTGTRWERMELAPGVISLRCLGTGPADARFLDGRTIDGSVGLAPSTDAPFSGTRWRVLSPSTVMGDGLVMPDDILAVHAALLPTGEILSFGGDEHDQSEHDTGAIDHTRLFQCATAGMSNPGSPTSDVFCCGHALMGDGRLLVAGGTEFFVHEVGGEHNEHFPGLHDAWVFDAFSRHWSPVARMSVAQLMQFRSSAEAVDPGGRWYPTLVTVASGEVLAVSGHPSSDDSRHNNHVAERFSASTSPEGAWTLLWPPNPAFESTDPNVYPRLHLLPNGAVFCSTPLAQPARSQLIDPVTGSRSHAGDPPPDPINIGGAVAQDGTSVLLPLLASEGFRPRVLLCGGSQPVIMDLQPLMNDPAASAPWVATAPRRMAALPPRLPQANPPRLHLNAVILPTGQVLLCGGCAQFRKDATAVLEPELYHPAGAGQPDRWETLQATQVPRNYHSVALLMPDGRVWTWGSNHDGQQGRAHLESRIEILNPPYMNAPARPTLTAGPRMSYGGVFSFQAQSDVPLRRVAILRAASVTHAFSSDQRYVGLDFDVSGGQVDVQEPPNANIAPPGYYLLFVIDENGIPSIGAFVQLG